VSENGNSILDEYKMFRFTDTDRKQILSAIKNKYVNVASSPKEHFRYPTGQDGLEYLKYDVELLEEFPDQAISLFCGVGNPLIIGNIELGSKVLDVGCGAGLETLLVARMVGLEGHATGIDISAEMLKQAKENQIECKIPNATFIDSTAEDLPFPSDSFDLIISNGVINMVVDKIGALAEIIRVLKPGGRLQMADQLLVGQMPSEVEAMVKDWDDCGGGAVPGKMFLTMLKEAGFERAKLLGRTDFDSSPVTMGTIIRGFKPDSELKSNEKLSIDTKKDELSPQSGCSP
tara:strand:+ start:25874 stop:26740 length:867 start_codon:yes stop_codon:yes gene_type:complete